MSTRKVKCVAPLVESKIQGQDGKTGSLGLRMLVRFLKLSSGGHKEVRLEKMSAQLASNDYLNIKKK